MNVRTRVSPLGMAAWALCVVMGTGMQAKAAETATPRKITITPETRLMMAGDSITQFLCYTRFVEAYLVACQPQAPALVVNLGIGSEKAGGFAHRMANDALALRPTLVTLCYGMNDANYRAFDDATEKEYRAGLGSVLDQLAAAKVDALVAGPGAVDTRQFNFKGTMAVSADAYNEALGKLSAIAAELAGARGFAFADAHAVCMDGMRQAKAKYGDDLYVFGSDGIHPNENGGFLYAYAFLKNMGFDGAIGTVTVHFPAATAEATAGHTVKTAAAKDGAVAVDLESARWPYCIWNGGGKRQTTEGMVEFVAFQKELNRFTLVVKDLPGESAEVQWGNAKRTFTKAQLAEGVNLAEAFGGQTPFLGPWRALDGVIADKQKFEVE